MKSGLKLKKLEHWHIIALIMMVFDVIAVNFSYFMGLWFRFDCAVSMIDPDYLYMFFRFIPVSSLICLIVFWALRLYNSIWRFASYTELMRILIAALCIIVIVMLINSSYGRAFKAIRDDEIAAEAMGINLFKHKQLSFCISSFFAGIGGALFAMFATNAQAKPFTSAMTYEILLIVVIGGIGSISGSCIATFLYVACSEWWLRFLDSEAFIGGMKVPFLRPGFRMVIFSIVIMIVVLFFRKGIMGDKELSYLFRRKKKPAPAVAEQGEEAAE